MFGRNTSNFFIHLVKTTLELKRSDREFACFLCGVYANLGDGSNDELRETNFAARAMRIKCDYGGVGSRIGTSDVSSKECTQLAQFRFKHAIFLTPEKPKALQNQQFKLSRLKSTPPNPGEKQTE
ncbi:hypothetical protein RRG08_022300 [Elysia crispata]|uniref:Uncharacterized protein n=1 Tax=Elysia crispata TaxID=231223 RepID=A0AAE0ZRF8_9GAST|nr:hypothetical protein RRG08_022300 [Elysia crispata]